LSSQLAVYLSKLFNPGEQSVAAHLPNDCKASSLREIEAATPQWVSVNPFKTWRAMENVTAFRNLVVEYDRELSVEEQVPFMVDMGFPITTAVYSGNKSIHFVCALSEPLSGIDEHYEVRRWLDIIFPGGDKSIKDPARLTRAPDALNAKTGKRQELLILDKRVHPSRLAAFLAKHEPKVKAHDEKEARRRAAIEEARMRGEKISFTDSQLRFLRGEESTVNSSRHARLYAIMCVACDDVGLPYEEALALAEECFHLQGVSSQRGREDEAYKIVNDVYFKRRAVRK
jgi:hypothetical protein